MNSFNRILILLLDLLIAAGAVLVLLITFGVITPAQVVPAGLVETSIGQWFASFAAMSPATTTLVTLVATVVILLSLLVVWYEVRSPRPEPAFTIREDAIGRVTVQLASVRNLITYTAAQFPQVLQVQPTMQQSPQGLTIQCRTSFAPDAHLPQVTSDLQERIKQVVEQHVGLRVVGVRIQAQLEPLAGGEVTYQPRPARRVLR